MPGRFDPHHPNRYAFCPQGHVLPDGSSGCPICRDAAQNPLAPRKVSQGQHFQARADAEDPLKRKLLPEPRDSSVWHSAERTPTLETPHKVVLPPAAQERRKRSAPRGLEAVAIEVECEVCRERFTPRSLNGGRRLYCSGKCRDRAYRARRGAKPRWYAKLLRDPFGHDKKRTKSPIRGVVVKVGEHVKVISP